MRRRLLALALGVPPADFVPASLQGQPSVGVIVCYHGDIEQGQTVLAPLLSFGTPVVDMVQPMPYLAVQQMIDAGNPHGMRNYWSADFYGDLPEEALDTLCEAATRPVSPMTQIVFVRGGGAIAKTAEDATAFGNRAVTYNVHYLSMWADPADTDSLIARATVEEVEGKLAGIDGGMRPKLAACADAIRGGAGAAHIIDGRRPHSLLVELFTDAGIGTMVTS